MPDGTVHGWLPLATHTPQGQVASSTLALGQSTGKLAPVPKIVLPHPNRSKMTPKRQRTRAEDVSRRHADDRQRNAERLAFERRQFARRLARDYKPPPF